MKNLKSSPKLLVLIVSIVIIIISIFTISNISAGSNKFGVDISANIVDMQSTIEEALNNGDIIVAGKVKRSYSYKISGVIFTNFIIRVNNTFKNNITTDIPNEIEVRVTGGNFEGEFLPYFESAKNLTENEKYLFILKKIYPDQPDNNFYAILGGEYQGVFKLKEADANITGVDETIVAFNSKNKLEKDLINKNINDILKIK